MENRVKKVIVLGEYPDFRLKIDAGVHEIQHPSPTDLIKRTTTPAGCWTSSFHSSLSLVLIQSSQ